MEEFTKFLDRFRYDMGVLGGDIRRMVKNKQKEAENPDTSKMGLRSMQNVTTLYADKKEIETAKTNPELDFIERTISRTLSK